MAKPVADPEPEPAAEPEPTDENDDKAWERFAPRFKALQKETLDEWMKERGASEPAAAGSGSGGAPAAGAGSGRESDPISAPRKVQASRPSGGSIFDLLLGR